MNLNNVIIKLYPKGQALILALTLLKFAIL